ncbi:MAG: FecR domain-containing protein, partial [Rhodocyclales bacterium]|nr:FecR domain-containing protein [Rhodocyclales bacterium]
MNRSLLRMLGFAALMSATLPAVAQGAAEAEIVAVTGKGERRATAQADWKPAAPQHRIGNGGFVRTRDLSQMAILLPDRTQLRLNQNSQMQIKTVADAAEWNQSVVKLNSGRAWSQARPPTAPAGTVAPAARLSMETPSATLSIRGTDWEVEIGSDGRTQLVVLSGEVDIANEQGALKVAAGEAATAEIGKAPVRLLLANPAERVQWVTAWQLQPRRWL